jgi:glycosylphosphatidylinositol transamidase (GPIT) subunit GPI8
MEDLCLVHQTIKSILNHLSSIFICLSIIDLFTFFVFNVSIHPCVYLSP